MKKHLSTAIVLMMSVWLVSDLNAQEVGDKDVVKGQQLPAAFGDSGQDEEGKLGRKRGRKRGSDAKGEKRGKGQRGQQGEGRRGGAEFMDFLFKRFDKDQDGNLSQTEAPERMKQRFDTIDADGNGMVSRNELSSAFEKMASQKGRGKGQGKDDKEKGAKGKGAKGKGAKGKGAKGKGGKNDQFGRNRSADTDATKPVKP